MKTISTKNFWLLLLIIVLTGNQIFAQTTKAFSDVSESSIAAKGQRYILAKQSRTLHLDQIVMQQFLISVSAKGSIAGRTSKAVFNMPMPDGNFSSFRIYETSVMEPELAAKFPELKTYAGQGIDDPTATVWLDQTPLGFHAMVLSSKGSVFIDPYCKGNTENYICYNKSEQINKGPWKCETHTTI